MGPQNVIIGGADFPEMPATEKDPVATKEILDAAKFRQSSDFKRLKEHFEDRIKYYQTYLPDGTPVATASPEERGNYWAIANIVITEFSNVIEAYDRAAEVVKDEQSAGQ